MSILLLRLLAASLEFPPSASPDRAAAEVAMQQHGSVKEALCSPVLPAFRFHSMGWRLRCLLQISKNFRRGFHREADRCLCVTPAASRFRPSTCRCRLHVRSRCIPSTPAAAPARSHAFDLPATSLPGRSSTGGAGRHRSCVRHRRYRGHPHNACRTLHAAGRTSGCCAAPAIAGAVRTGIHRPARAPPRHRPYLALP